MIEPIVALDGEALRAPEARSALGRPVWSLGALLADLELRLGMAPYDVPHAERVERYAAALRREARADGQVFYARSLAADALGTAATLLGHRDELVLAGWDGGAMGSPRVDALAAVEVHGGELSAWRGPADRVVGVERALLESTWSPYACLHLVDPPDVLPHRWSRLLSRLGELGSPALPLASPSAPLAPAASDLGRLQRATSALPSESPRRRGARASAAPPLTGDGTFVLLTAETTLEAGEALASWLATRPSVRDTALILGPDAGPLDAALARRGLPTLGAGVATASRSPLAVLPWALAASTEPKDPSLLLALLTLPIRPFGGRVGRTFAEALADWPSLRSQAWRDARAKLEAEPGHAEALARVAAWIEAPGVPARESAPRDHWRAVAERVAAWARARLGTAVTDDDRRALGGVVAQCVGFLGALAADGRAGIDLQAAQRLVELATPELATSSHPEQAGRLDSVDAPHALLTPVSTLVWWSFVDGAVARPRPSPWRRDEQAALAGRGVRLVDPAARLRRDAHGWRRAFALATERFVGVIPRALDGEATGPHPLHDEWAARLGERDAGLERVVFSTTRLLFDGRSATRLLSIPLTSAPPLAPPAPRAEWSLPKGLVTFAKETLSVTSLDALLACPLRWVLERKARLRDQGPARLPDGPLLAGSLGHLAVERLHRAGAWALRGEALRERAEREVDELLQMEASVLLREGQLLEASQLRRQLVDALVAFGELLDAAKLQVTDVELDIDLPFLDGTLRGRLDVLVADASGRERVVDLKWGGARYQELLGHGRAVQLAAYSHARRRSTRRKVPVAYFSLARGSTFALDEQAFPGARISTGPTIEETWAAVEGTAKLVADTAREGRLPVVGNVREPDRATRLHTVLDPRGASGPHLDLPPDHACEYCALGAICGKRWSGA